jgi:hypothetical protein
MEVFEPILFDYLLLGINCIDALNQNVHYHNQHCGILNDDDLIPETNCDVDYNDEHKETEKEKDKNKNTTEQTQTQSPTQMAFQQKLNDIKALNYSIMTVIKLLNDKKNQIMDYKPNNATELLEKEKNMYEKILEKLENKKNVLESIYDGIQGKNYKESKYTDAVKIIERYLDKIHFHIAICNGRIDTLTKENNYDKFTESKDCLNNLLLDEEQLLDTIKGDEKKMKMMIGHFLLDYWKYVKQNTQTV